MTQRNKLLRKLNKKVYNMLKNVLDITNILCKITMAIKPKNEVNMEKKYGTFLVRDIPKDKWSQFKIKVIKQGDGTMNQQMLKLIDKYLQS
mgnify:CR=1 FL=1